MSWSDLQASFARALTDPASPAPDIFARCDAATRFNVYRNNVAMARIEALKAQFPVVLELVGEAFFQGMARVFAQSHSARSPILSDYGAEFPGFVEEFAYARDYPYLGDVARLERLCLQALNAADRAPLPVEKLAAIDPETLLDGNVQFHPAFGCLASEHPIVSIWAAHRNDEAGPLENWRPETAIVLRPDGDVSVRACPAGAAAFIAAAAKGASLREAAEAGISADPEFDFGHALVEMVAIGAIAELGFKHGGECKP